MFNASVRLGPFICALLFDEDNSARRAVNSSSDRVRSACGALGVKLEAPQPKDLGGGFKSPEDETGSEGFCWDFEVFGDERGSEGLLSAGGGLGLEPDELRLEGFGGCFEPPCREPDPAGFCGCFGVPEDEPKIARRAAASWPARLSAVEGFAGALGTKLEEPHPEDLGGPFEFHRRAFPQATTVRLGRSPLLQREQM